MWHALRKCSAVVWVLNIHGSVHSVPLKKYLSWYQSLGQWCCPLWLQGWCHSCRLLFTTGCCAGPFWAALQPSLEGKPRHGEVQHFVFGGERKAALRQSCFPSVSCKTELSCFATCWSFYVSLGCSNRGQWSWSDLALLIFLTDLVWGVGCIPCNCMQHRSSGLGKLFWLILKADSN